MADNGNAPPVYLVIGATGGIGSELCRRLAKGGAKLVVGARDEERLDDLADRLTSDEEWAETIALNMTTAFGTIKAAAKHMPHGGSVVLLSSVAARVGLANHEAIAAAKAGVVGLALSAAATYVGRDLRVNAVAPGLVQTPMTESVTRSETARQASVDLHPLGRLGESTDVAAMIEWLLDPANT